MKIAIPYENGNIVKRFEKATAFKVYTIKENKVDGTDIVFVDVENKQSPVRLLLDNGVNTVIGWEYVKIAIMMLMRAGIEIIAGAEGDADKAIEEYLAETLITEEKTSCGHSCADCDRGCSK